MKKKTNKPNTISEQVEENTKGISTNINIFLFIFTVIFLIVLYNKNESYKWMYEQMLKGNIDFIKENPDLTYDQKIESKFQLDYSVLKTIKDQTPENAIIIFPTRKILDTVRKVNKLPNRNENFLNKDWVEYYIFPRKIIFSEDKNSSKLQPTFALILGGMGYENLNYQVQSEQRKFLEVLLINK